MPLVFLASAHSRSSLPSMRKSEFATSTPLNGSGLINGIEAIILFGILTFLNVYEMNGVFYVIKNDEPVMCFNFEKNNKNTAQRHNS